MEIEEHIPQKIIVPRIIVLRARCHEIGRDFRLGTPCTCNRGDGLGQVVVSRLRIEKREKRYNIIRERKNPKVGSIAVLGCDNDPRKPGF